MGNRRKSALTRQAQMYRNAGRRAVEALFGQPRYNRDGTLKRAEGRHNHPYGARPGASKSILRVHADGARNKYPAASHGVNLADLNREQLRAVCKERGIKGYGKMSVAQLREALA